MKIDPRISNFVLKIVMYAILSFPFLLTALVFYEAYNEGIIWHNGFVLGTVSSVLIIVLFVGNKEIESKDDRVLIHNVGIWGLFLLLSWIAREVYSWNRFAQEFFLPIFPVTYSTLTLKIGYKERSFFFKNIPKKKPKVKKPIIEVSTKGNDDPWLGDNRYIGVPPIEKTFIRGFNKNMKSLSEIIGKISGDYNLLFYALYEPKKGVFDEIVCYSEKAGLYHQVMDSNQGESLAVECKNRKALEMFLENFWVGEYICWIVAHSRSFTNMAETMRRTLNPLSFPDGFSELINGSYCFFRDVEKGKVLLVLSDKVSIEEIQEIILKKV